MIHGRGDATRDRRNLHNARPNLGRRRITIVSTAIQQRIPTIPQRIAEELGVRRAAGDGGRRAARRRLDRAVHRPLPQGSHRDARRRAAAHAGGAAALPARAGGAAGRDPRVDRARRASSTTRCEAQILAADSKARLEDIYLPYKPKRRTKAQIAREAGLEPLADALLGRPDARPAAAAAGLRRRRARASPTPPPRWTAPGPS